MTDFSVDYMDDDEYTYRGREHHVKVRIDERQNGARVGATVYTPDGDRLAFHRFRINDVEHRALVYPKADEDTTYPDDVHRALHAGGWQVVNMFEGCLTPEEDDPFEVQMLDIRDGFRDSARAARGDFEERLYTALATAVEESMLMLMVYQSIRQKTGKSPEELSPGEFEELGDFPEGMLEGSKPAPDSRRLKSIFQKAVETATTDDARTLSDNFLEGERKFLVEQAEYARNLWEQTDMDYGEAYEIAQEEV